ncbi:MAG: thymidine phosphorylase [Candidatus Nanopelagicales bacterium]|jgi:thymidine phosphorylase|nr:thymidine phosphorylase [Actinomycetota bacterium]
MNFQDLIYTKRDGGILSEEQIRWFIDKFTKNEIPDEQAGSFLMAVFFRGLNKEELNIWTDAMIKSGEKLDLSTVGKPTVDKHSTGGVGDKISLPLCPLVASFGAAVPQLSGRGLGTFGGTLDKMESVSGFNISLTNEQMIKQLKDVGVFITAAGVGLAPADRKMYSFRDVIGAVECIPLIASSIMSKKIAEGTQSLVLDVKAGRGAFMKDFAKAKQLAETMVEIGNNAGVKTVALITQMETPLGNAVGNALEVSESIDVLNGKGPSDVIEITLALAKEMLNLAGINKDPAEGLKNGSAFNVWKNMIKAQGGNPDAEIPVAKKKEYILANESGYITDLNAYSIGLSAWRLGAGRAKKEDAVSKTAGIICLAKEGTFVEKDQPVLELHIDDETRITSAKEALLDAFEIGPEPKEKRKIVLERIS